MFTATKPPALLVFAGLDPSGGAGLVADIQTATAFGVHVLAVATTLTSQSLTEFDSYVAVDAVTVESQARAAVRGFDVKAVKVGAVPSRPVLDAIVRTIGELRPAHVVVDPVRASSSGGVLSDALSRNEYRERVLSVNPVLTPNRAELAELCATDDATPESIESLLRAGARAVLVTDGDGNGELCTHRLFEPDGLCETFTHTRLDAVYRGSGCTLATALAAQLVNGLTLVRATESALEFTFAALKAASVCIDGGNVCVPDRRVHR